MQSYFLIIKNKKAGVLILLLAILFPFNNCQKYQSTLSQSGETNSSSLSTTTTPPTTTNNSLIVSCLPKSQLTSVSSKLSFKNSSNKLSKELKLSEWDQSQDLVLIIDNVCLEKNNYQDIILQYLPENSLQKNSTKSVVVLKKETVLDLAQFNSDALVSECLQAADLNKNLKISTVDPRLADQSFYNSINFNSTLMNRILSYNGGSLYTTRVGIVDSGVDGTNPDLTPQLEKNAAGQFVGINVTNSSSNFSDSGYHGTHVAGLVGAAYDNGISGTGAYGKNITLLPARVSKDGNGATLGDVASGLIWASNQKADLINLSMGSEATSPVYQAAIETLVANGTFLCVAAGNDSREITTTATTYPAMYTDIIDGMITVGSFDASSLQKSSFSNYSTKYVDVLAPGSNGTAGILSTVPIALNPAGMANKITVNGVTSPIHGTSMATPIMTGALAAVVSMAKGRGIKLTPSQLKRFVRNEGTPTKAAYASYSRGGKYLDYNYLITALIEQIDSTTKTIEIDTTQLTTQKSLIGQKVSFKAVLTANSKYLVNYQWFKNGVAISNANSDVLTLSNISTTDAAQYHVEISSGNSKYVSQKVPLVVGQASCD